MSKMLPRIAERVLNRPLMIHPDKLALIAQILDGRIAIDASDFKAIEIDEQLRKPGASRFVGSRSGKDGKSYKPYRIENGTAIIEVVGSLVNRGAWLGSYSGLTSYEGLGFQFDTAKTDADVERVILDLDSPGGEAVGCFEVAEKVAALALTKEVVAVVNGMAASAAYAIASQATMIVTTPSGITGSVGCVMLHADYSQMLVKQGIKPTLIHAGAHKVDGNPYEPLSEAVKADLRAEVDQFYDLFVSSVAKGRRALTEKAVRATEARTYIGQAAVDAGIADSVGSFDSVMADFARRPNRQIHPAPSNGLIIAAQDQQPRSQVDQLAIVELGAKLGLAKAAAIMADMTPAQISLDAALETLKIAARNQSRAVVAVADQRHECGLYFGEAAMEAGPVFVGPAEPPTDDNGWGDTIAKLNASNRPQS